ncbi:MAG TPA: phosphatase PAP2 family protein [Pseudolabrys sp.]|nr:phosphatase PAP2 family protein [Pseudolabrys sp.]
MSIADTLRDRLPAAGFGRQMASALRAATRRHRFLHALALSALLLAACVGAKTGNRLDFSTVEQFGGYLFMAFALFGCGFALVRLLWLAFVERDPAPLGAFCASFARFFGDPERIANGINGMAVFLAFSTAFGVLKGAIAILSPFAWDRALSQADRILSFGRAPYELLWPLVDNHFAVALFNAAYNLWFFVLLGTIFTAVFARRDTALRHQFLATFMLTWIAGGFFIAVAFSSAGPCYFGRLGLGGDYRPLMDALKSATHDYPVWALATQDTLWKGYLDPRAGSVGISAFPSMHIATAMLFALYWQRRSALTGALMWIFAGMIFVGSIVLGWHYAVDGIGAALIVLPCWKFAGRAFGRFAAEG